MYPYIKLFSLKSRVVLWCFFLNASAYGITFGEYQGAKQSNSHHPVAQHHKNHGDKKMIKSNNTNPGWPQLFMLAKWEESMTVAGNKWGQYLMNPDINMKWAISNTTYYDSQRIFFQIADYTGQDEPWNTYAQRAEEIYRDFYARPDYTMPGYRRFPHGIYMDFVRTGDPISAAGIPLIRDAPAYSNPEQFDAAYMWHWQDLSREIAYAIGAHVLAERAGHARNQDRVPLFIAMALSHINEWTTGERGNPDTSKHRFSPFMFALTAEALISYYEWEVERGANPDNTIPNALRTAADFLWSARVTKGPNTGKTMWIPDLSGRSYSTWGDLGGTGYGAFRYEDCDCSPAGSRPAPGLNLLIVPAYAWLFKHFGDPKYLERGDLIWEGGVSLSQADIRFAGKQFNQNYRWSFEYVKWRSEGTLKWPHSQDKSVAQIPR
ncbi:MAG: glycoside hydrolase family 76 protein [Gammaproteobacteria bacterium]|nr:glycoside hydrolase family 76 protein [Gammaproteobacteria bacterium]